MGFIKKDGYTSERLGVTIEQAYAKITHINIHENTAHVTFSIQQNRDDIDIKPSIDNVFTTHEINKTLPIYEQIYIEAKEKFFNDWEDDIVVEETTDEVTEEAVEESIEETVEE